MRAAEVAEDLMAYLPLGPGGEYADLGAVRLSLEPGPSPYFATASRLRGPAGAADALIDEVRAWFASRGRQELTWWLGPSTTPPGLADRLLLRGAAPEPPGAAMVLTEEPPAIPGVDVRQVRSPEDLAVFREILFEVDDSTPDDKRRAVADGLTDAWEHLAATGRRRAYFLACRDDEPVAAGGLLFTEQGVGALAGGATRPWARGNGCYRALVRRRWEHARELGSGTLVTQASPMSRPVLERLGFQVVADLTILLDQT